MVKVFKKSEKQKPFSYKGALYELTTTFQTPVGKSLKVMGFSLSNKPTAKVSKCYKIKNLKRCPV